MLQIKRKKKKKCPFLDDEAEIHNACSSEESTDAHSSDLDFIDDSEEFTIDKNFNSRKEREIAVNREKLKQFLESLDETIICEIGFDFSFSNLSDIF